MLSFTGNLIYIARLSYNRDLRSTKEIKQLK